MKLSKIVFATTKPSPAPDASSWGCSEFSAPEFGIETVDQYVAVTHKRSGIVYYYPASHVNYLVPYSEPVRVNVKKSKQI